MPKLRVGGDPRPGFQRVGLNIGDVISIQKTLLDARRMFKEAGDVATADAIAVIFERFGRRMRQAAERTAAVAEREIVAIVDQTRVRPDTGRGAPKLRDQIKAEPWDPTPNVVTGTVVIGLHAYLDKLPYWRVQEYGHHFAHSPKGFFMGAGYQGFSAPNPAMFRMHPLFMPSAKGRKFIRPPVVPARHFLRDGTDKAVAYWRGETATVIAQATAELNRLLARRGQGALARRAARP